MKKIFAVEGNFNKRGWQFLKAYGTQEQALFAAQQHTQGLYPVWLYRVRPYAALRPSKVVKSVRSRKSEAIS